MGRQDQGFGQRRRRSTRPHSSAHQAAATATVEILPRAGVWVRLAALVYDSLLLIGLLAVTNLILVALVTPREAVDNQTLTVLSAQWRYGLLLPASLLVIYGFYGYCWKKGGQTLGMQTWRLTARRRDGEPLGWGDSLRRCLGALLVPLLLLALASLNGASHKGMASALAAGLLFNYAWAWLPFSRLPSGRCLHDWLSRTDVLRLPKKPSAKASSRK